MIPVSLTTRTRYLPTLALVLLLASPALGGELPKIDNAFVDTHLILVETSKEETLSRPVSSLSILEGIREIVGLRQNALFELDREMSLSSLDGVETLDFYDHGAVLALYELTAAYVSHDSTAPPQDHLERFNAVLGGIPSLGQTPVGFMVFGVIDMTLGVTDTLWSNPALSRPELAKTAIRLIHVGTDLYHETRSADEDFGILQMNTRFRTNSAVMRLRCPKDDSVYRVVDIRRRASEKGNMLRTYYLQCQVCDEPRIVEFIDELQTRLNKMADKQKVKKNTKRSKTRSLDP